LQELKQKLLINKESNQAALSGLGGIGKTQTALEFAYRVKADRPDYSIFWIPAQSMETMEQACGDIARTLKIPGVADGEEDVKELVKRYLSSGAAGKWLLIVDNADDMKVIFSSQQSEGIADYMPQSENGITLYTTRNQEVAVSFADSDVIELEEMDKQEAVSFLKSSLIRKNLLDNHILVTELLDELATLPLAIAQAAAYLNRNKNASIADYLRLLRNAEHDMISLLSENFRDNTRYKNADNAVAKTWLVSFNQIRDQHPAAADLLSFMSCIEPKAIPHSILPSLWPEELMIRAIGMLCAYSFIAKRGDEDIYDMHRLVHVATGIWVMKHGIAEKTLEKAIQHVSNVFPDAEHNNLSICRGYLVHALRLLTKKLDTDVVERYTLCSKVGECLRQEGRFKECVKCLEEVYQWRTNKFTEEHPDRLASQHILAIAYQDDRQIKKAVELLEHEVTVRRKILAEEHPDRLASQHVLAMAYRADGQTKKAVEIIEHVVTIRRRILAEEHLNRLASQHELALGYRADGQIKKTVELLEHVVTVNGRIRAEEHPDCLASQHELALAYRADGQIEKAVELLEYVVAMKADVFRQDHPDRLVSQHELALGYRADGQIKKTVELLEHVVTIHRRILAEEHPDRLASQHVLAMAYREDGQTKKAVEMIEHVVTIRKRILAEEHPDRLASQHVLAMAYRAYGQSKKAVELLEYVVTIRNGELAEQHPDRLKSQHELAITYQGDGQINKAIELLEYVVTVRKRILAEEHPDRLASQHELAIVYQANGQTKKAVELLEHVVAVQSNVFRQDHPSRLRSEHMLKTLQLELLPKC
jgi:tetratricopeptide (TPR) repeat protein